MNGRFQVAILAAFCALFIPVGSALAVTLSGRVYEGNVGDESKPLAGVTVTLYGSNNSGVKGISIKSTTTNSDGWYGLELEGVFEYYHIVETNPAQYVSVGATTVSGDVKDSDWIEYSYIAIEGTTTGNKFWDKKEGQPPANRPPVANDDSASTHQDTLVTINVLANDSDPDGDPLGIQSVTDPPHGTAVRDGQTVRYTPDSGFTGSDSFSYTISDGRGGTSTANVTVRVAEAPVENRPPVAQDDSATTNQDMPVTINVLTNDSDPDGDPLSIQNVTDPPHGTAVRDGQTVRYTPDSGFTGSDSFSYTISDGRGGTNTANVTVRVAEAPVENRPPVAQDDSASTSQDTAVTIDVLANDTDPDGDPLHVNSVTDPPHGTAVNHGSYVTYTPDSGFTGTDTFDYTAGDGRGGTDTATVTVTIEQGTEPPPGTGTLDGYKRDADTGAGLANWRIYIDLNGNGQWDAGEPGDLTDGNGYYRIADVEPGTYRVCEEMQAGWESDAPCVEGVAVVAGVTTTQDFHNRRTQPPGDQRYTFDVCFNVEIILADGTSHRLSLTGPATMRVWAGPNGEATDTNSNGLDDVQAELVDLQLAGLDPVLGSVALSLNPGAPSTGRIEERANNTAGILDIPPFTASGTADSFFDVWLQIDVSSLGQTLLSGQAKRLAGVIDHVPPSSNAYSEPVATTIDLVDQNDQVTGLRLGPVTSCLATYGSDYGDAPAPYPDASHTLGQVWMGFRAPDAETGTQASPPGQGDDTSGVDDEDGASFPSDLVAGQFGWVGLALSGTTQNATFAIWIDYNRNGAWEHPAELFASSNVGSLSTLPLGMYIFNPIPSSAQIGTTYVRCRVYPGHNAPISPTGHAQGGEVEDYQVEIKLPATPIQPPGSMITGIAFNDLDGDGIWDPADGEKGLPNWPIWLDTDNDGAPDQTTTTDSQGGFEFPGLSAGTYTVGQEQQPGWTQTAPQPPGTFSVTIPGGELPTIHFVMFGDRRTGQAGDRDYGDAPLPYPEASHQLGGPYLGLPGDMPDPESGMQRDAQAAGDDNDANGDDENGLLSINLVKTPGVWSSWDLSLNLSNAAKSGLWLDLNGDGDWDDPGELVSTGMFSVSGLGGAEVHFLMAGAFPLPVGAKTGMTYARLRVYDDANATISPSGAGGPGEVEDYLVEIKADGPGVPPGGIVHGYKWNDLDGDGLWDTLTPKEPALAGWTIWLDTNGNGKQDAGDRTTQTDANGHFRFAGVPAGTYKLGEQLQTGWTQTTPGGAGTYSITVQPGQGTLAQMFGNRRAGQAGDRDYGDAPLPYPEASHQLGGPYLGPFGDAPDAETGMQRDAQAAGDDNDANGDDENGLLAVNLVKTSGVWSTWEIKGYYNASSDVKFGLWLDLNGDGDWDDSGESLSTFGFCGFGTGPQDWFRAMGAFQLPAGAKAGTTYARLRVYDDCNVTLSPSGAGGPGEVEDYLVEIKSDGPGVPPGGIVHGYKWNDINGNGLWDILSPVEPPLAGWTFWLDTNGNGKQDAGDMTTQTDAQGHFRFTGVPAGTYTLGEQLQSGWTQTTPGGAGTYSVTVQPGQGTFPQMFGNRQFGGSTSNGQICGSKWNDLDGNAVMDAGEPYLSGWTVYLDMNHNGQLDAGEPTRLTDASGAFLFTGLAVGSYTVAEQMQTGWTQTWPGGAGTHTISIQPTGAQPVCVMFGNTTHQVPPPDTLKKLDWGDAPDPTYPTLRTSNGAYHVIVPGFHLGQDIDGESDGQPAPDALGDDHFGADDEDGVVFLTPILPGGTAELEITASAAGFVDAWIDFDGDGTWSQSSDQILTAEPVAAGSNVLSVVIPALAQSNAPTFARFRLSHKGGLPPNGPAQDGEVEDYHILLGEDGPYVPGEGQRPHVKWSQPPLEIDPNIEAPPVFCGWNEAARSTQYSGQRRQWRMDADDFRCLGPVPITRIRWWGGYKGWEHPEPPALQPDAWHIGFWANQVEGMEADQLYPERLVWSVEVPNDRVGREPVGLNEFPQKFPEMCFIHEVRLEPDEWFRQAEFPSNADVLWLSITAIYPTDAEAVNQWGWATRPHVWGRGAVMPAIMGEWPTYDERLFPGRITPIQNSSLCEQNQAYDLCFELLTEPPWIKWDQPFTGVRDWPHYEDPESQGTSVRQQENIGRMVADDWLCESGTPVIAAAWWGSYVGYGYEACQCNQQPRPPQPDYFLLRIWTHAPAGGGAPDSPGDVLWEYRAFEYDEVLAGHDRNPEGEPNEPVFRYSVRLPEENWFHPGGRGETNWFSVTAIYADPLPMLVHPWGWTNHPHAFGNGGEFIDYRLATPPQWWPLNDPESQPIDMSFTLFTIPE